MSDVKNLKLNGSSKLTSLENVQKEYSQAVSILVILILFFITSLIAIICLYSMNASYYKTESPFCFSIFCPGVSTDIPCSAPSSECSPNVCDKFNILGDSASCNNQDYFFSQLCSGYAYRFDPDDTSKIYCSYAPGTSIDISKYLVTK